jgi:putative peptidoglycan lipid II flippase
LARRGHFTLDTRLRARAPRILLAGLGMAAVLFGGVQLLAGMLAGSDAARILALVALVAGGIAGYGALSVLVGAAVPAELRGMMRRRGA